MNIEHSGEGSELLNPPDGGELLPKAGEASALKALALVALTTRYTCRGCGTEYDDLVPALQCAKRGFHPQFKVGDLVTTSPKWGWFDGDPDWVLPDEPFGGPRFFHEVKLHWFLYVVTAVDHDRSKSHGEDGRFIHRAAHRPRYHLMTLAMGGSEATHSRGWGGGYTFSSGHYAPLPLPDPYPYLWALDQISEKGLWGPTRGLL